MNHSLHPFVELLVCFNLWGDRSDPKRFKACVPVGKANKPAEENDPVRGAGPASSLSGVSLAPVLGGRSRGSGLREVSELPAYSEGKAAGVCNKPY